MSASYTEVWNRCLAVIKDNVNEGEFNTWFMPIVPVKLNEDTLTLQIPSQFFYEYIEEKYANLLHKVLSRCIGPKAHLMYRIAVDSDYKQKGFTVIPGNPAAVEKKNAGGFDSHLNYNYTFDNFIEGECNKLPRSAGLSIAANPGKSIFNPLFVYGRSGVGKTHLANAIGLKTKELHPEKKVLYVSANLFQLQYTEAVRNNKTNDFVNFYQTVDLLIIDDIQEFGEGKRVGTQHTFFHIFNHLRDAGKQLVLTCDKKPAELEGLEERLLTRFKSGLSVEIEIPNFETRKAILQSKIEKDGVRIPESVVNYIAEHVQSNIRDLEGTVASLLAYSTMTGRTINIDLAKRVISNLVAVKKNDNLSIDAIKQAVCDYYDIPQNVLVSNSRKREYVQARQVAMYFAKQLTEDSLTNIGCSLGNRTHATVLHACKTVQDLMETDKGFRLSINEIENKLKQK